MKLSADQMKILLANPLFQELNQKQILHFISQPFCAVTFFNREEIIILCGEPIKKIGILLSGTLRITKTDYDGSQLLITKLEPGALFGESFACAGGEIASVTVTSDTETDILFLNRIENLPALVQRNLMTILARKNLFLNQRISLLSLSSIRGKVFSLLREECGRQQRNPFYLTMNRNEMADYLCVDRSALSRELGKMKEEHLIDYHKNCFRLMERTVRK